MSITAAKGSKIVAAYSGKVVQVGKVGEKIEPWFGNYVAIDSVVNGIKYRMFYGHMDSTDTTVGWDVQAGDTIGYVGNTGNSKGNHCHFEVRVSPYRKWDNITKRNDIDCVNPLPFLD